MGIGLIVLVGVVYLLATARLTRLVNGDTILDPLRTIPLNRMTVARNTAKDARRAGQNAVAREYAARARRWNTVLYFIECPWCVGMWVTMGTAWLPLWHWDNRLVQYIGIALAASHLIGVFAFAADTEEVDVEEDES